MHLYTILCGVFQLAAVIQSAAVKQDTGVVSANVGDDVILHCFHDSQVSMHFSWYRQTLGNSPELLSTFYKYDEPSKVLHWLENSRFSVVRMEGRNHLRISDVQLSDSATYLCGSSHSNMVEFGEGVFLSVRGATIQEIVQEPMSETVLQGGSVTLNCMIRTATCNTGHSVYWFRHGDRQGILHTHEDQCKNVSTSEFSSGSCVYHFQRTNLLSSDTGTYFCAVASCGEILFGNGTTLLISEDVIQMRILAWLSIIRIGILLFFLTVCLLVYKCKSRRHAECGSS
ncbi:uncharacterized protein LOC115058766 [Echeneis naucrates]|uniref:uncharacterized protein LOC115058766 n=1 Tax=Echeneis naucrates TaxID=173247 RepID=UPI0011135A06|nr:uncharacterized protein LOC115058766 [Echeneis naucrates]XP_029382117.1 uncharacterized protein LOC115058766 [Echeneis naucrates]